MSTTKTVEMVKISSSNRVKVTLMGTGPEEAINALVRYLDLLQPAMSQQRAGLTPEVAALFESTALILDLSDNQIAPQMRGNEAPEVLKLSLSRMEAIRLWALAMQDPAPVDVQIQWLTAMNEIHQKMT